MTTFSETTFCHDEHKIVSAPNTDGWGNKLVTVFAFAPATKTNS